MSAESREFTLDVSEHFFHLTTESIRLRSNETRRYQTLSSLIDSRILEAKKIDDHDSDTLRDHLEVVPTKGAIRINLTISKTSADLIGDARNRLATQLGTDLSFGDALSILLFDYVVERKAAHVLSTLGLDEMRDNHDEPIASDSQEGNPFSNK
ncbi:hypothetical protein [Rhizorhapis sp. SPR117]|uniref:hypothetical protein n=1 Tax=Rhizorhapis sp. SPR117 TaxID=2912611 RepID=UPI001F476BF5|nr:hypothetical protein [Rhizorhapis sp. SPR117]